MVVHWIYSTLEDHPRDHKWFVTGISSPIYNPMKYPHEVSHGMNISNKMIGFFPLVN